MSDPTFTNQLNSYVERINKDEWKGEIALEGDQLTVTPTIDYSKLNVLEGSTVRSEDGADIAFETAAQDKRSLLICDFIYQTLDRLQRGPLSVADYNNLGCAYIWCRSTNTSPSAKDKADAEKYFRLALSEVEEEETRAKIQKNIDLMNTAIPLPPLALTVPESDIAGIEQGVKDAGDAQELLQKLQQ